MPFMGSRGLAASASGTRVVYEIGVLRQKVDIATDPLQTAWKHVYGTSGGALIASFLSMYPLGQEKMAVRALEKIIIDFMGECGIRSYFPFGIVQGLLLHSSLFDPAVLESLV